MNESVDVDLLIFGILLVGLGVVAHRLAPESGGVTLIIGITGGAASVTCGVLRLRRLCRRIWPIGTLAAVVVALSVQVIRAWLKVNAGTNELKPVAVILTVLLVFGIGQLVNVARTKDCAE